MDLVSPFVLLLSFHLLLLQADSDTCPESFLCGSFDMEFPLTNNTNPGCGLITVHGCDTPGPKTIFTDRYTILEEVSKNKFVVLDNQLLDYFRSKDSCLLFRNLSTPPPPLSFTYSPNLTLFYCFNQTSQDDVQNHFETYRRINANFGRSSCISGAITLYYSDDIPETEESNIPTTCSMIQLPLRRLGDSDDLFSWSTPNFTFEWSVPPDCVRSGNNEYDCDRGNINWKLILGISLPGGVVLFILLLAGYILWQRRKKLGGIYLLPRSLSFDPSSRTDIEDGSFNLSIPIFSYTELVEATSNFDSSKELGDGGFGTVYYGKLRDGREVAIKRLYEHNYRRVEQFLNEIKILTSLRHPNLVSLYGCTSRRSRELLLVYEYIPNGTVADHLQGERAKEAPLSWPVRLSIAIETAAALAYLHKSVIVHRDVKTNNILLDNNFSVKVADFGLSRLFPTNVTHISTAPQGTPGYVDPEYHQCYQLTDKSDVYSFGVVLIELISSMPAVDISRHKHEINLANLAVNRIQKCAFDELIDPSTGYNSDPEVTRMATSVAELAFRCLQPEKDLRPRMEEVVVFLKDIQDGQDCFFEQIKEGNDNNNFGKIPPSPETDDTVLLKSKNFQSSPNAVTDAWISSTSTTASSVG